MESDSTPSLVERTDTPTHDSQVSVGANVPQPDFKVIVTDEVPCLIEQEVRRQIIRYEKSLLHHLQHQAPEEDSNMELKLKDSLDNLEKRQADTSDQRKESRVSTRSGYLSSKPTTASRPFTSNQLGSSLQEKASWRYASIAASDDMPLTAGYLEHELTERVIAGQPDRRFLDVSEVMVREMASSVVREIVGILDCLVDRLLMEKKQDQLRTMVASLMTEDVAATVAVAAGNLRDKEMGHVMKELERLRGDLVDNQALWEERFKVTGELKDSHSDLWQTLDSRCGSIEENAANLEASKIPRPEFDSQLKALLRELQETNQRVSNVEKSIQDKDTDIKRVAKRMQDEYATKSLVKDVDKRLSTQAEEAMATTRNNLRKLREDAAPLDEFTELKDSHEAILESVRSQLVQLMSDHHALESQFKKSLKENVKTFVTKFSHEQDTKKMSADLDQLGVELSKEITGLQADGATKADVQDMKQWSDMTFKTLQQTVDQNRISVDQSSSALQSLEEAMSKLATREYAYNVANQLAREVADGSHEKEEIAQLTKLVHDEQERMHQTVRQQQDLRKEFNTIVEDTQQLQSSNASFHDVCEALQGSLANETSRTGGEIHQLRALLVSQKQSLVELQERHKSLRDEFRSHVELQRNESEGLKEHSTKRYLEQMDSALGLHRKLEKLEHCLKLPTIS